MYSGLNGLQGLTVTQFHLYKDPVNGQNAYGNVTIPNPSVSTVTFGDVSLNMFVNGTFIGTSTLPDLTLMPGNHSYPLLSNSNQTTIAGLLQQPAYKCGVLPIDMKGNASIYNGKVLPYFTKPFQTTSQRVVLNLTSTLDAAGFGFLINGTCET